MNSFDIHKNFSTTDCSFGELMNRLVMKDSLPSEDVLDLRSMILAIRRELHSFTLYPNELETENLLRQDGFLRVKTYQAVLSKSDFDAALSCEKQNYPMFLRSFSNEDQRRILEEARTIYSSEFREILIKDCISLLDEAYQDEGFYLVHGSDGDYRELAFAKVIETIESSGITLELK